MNKITEADPCCFCFTDGTTATFGVQRDFDLRGVAARLAAAIRARNMRFRACSACAKFVRAKDLEGLQRRATDIYATRSKSTRDENIAAMTALVNSLLWQEIFWLGNSLNFTNVIALSSVISPPFRVAFDMYSAGRPDVDQPTYANGVELFLWPFFEAVIVDTIRSSQRGMGYASKTMRLLTASADRHAVELIAEVEPDTYSQRLSDGLDSRGLQDWFQRLGFVLDAEDADGVTMRRKPDFTLSTDERRARYEQALKDL